MAFIKSVFLFGIVLLLQSCGTTYGPTGQYGGFPHGGYGETRISADKYIVHYTGNYFDKLPLVKDYLLYRCAELTLDQGYDYFVVLSTTTSSVNVSLDTRSSYHRVDTFPRTYSRSVQIEGYSTSPSTFPQRNEAKLHGAVAYIQMFEGSMPANLPNAYSATEVLAHLGPN